MERNIPKAYESNTSEPEIYKLWENSGYSTPERVEQYLRDKGFGVKEPFTITLPPPNANGNLHLGHMCGYSFHDAFARYNRMNGHPTLLVPGKDHAGIQTEVAFTKYLESQGNSKWKMGREEFYKQCYDFCIKNANNARIQEKNIGLSADYSREFFTLDPKLTKTVYETFFKMYKEGLIYRDKRIVNICPHDKTALADIDTSHEERRGIFAYIVYPFAKEEDRALAKERFGVEGITVATTRPETMLGDTAVAVNSKDVRYKDFVGKKVVLPFVNREIEIIADDEVDTETGTGAVKITPAHSPIDFEMGKRHNLEIVNVIDEDGKMSGDIPERFIGMETVECSKALCSELEKMGLLVKIENIKHEVVVCERCGTPVEPVMSNQWFVNVKPLAEKAIDALHDGRVRVIPEGQQRALEFFFEHIEPWCISRQLWWGQRIPVWYSKGKKAYDNGEGDIYIGENKPEGDWEEESDVFDTWFSSGQLPYSTLGGLEGEDFIKYYPTQLMIHARDILFWWTARMIMFGLYKTGKVPYSTVLLTGMILASDGSKMSKSKGNGVEPSDIFKKYGADALRLWYYSDALPGSNAPIREEKIKGNRNFVNKIWNASRFILMNIEDEEIEDIKNTNIEDTERILLTKDHIKRVHNYLDRYQLNLGAESIREFFWHELCDKWIEEIKVEIKDQPVGSDIRIEKLSELLWLLKENLKVMHPFVPFVTEAVWQELVKLGLAEDLLMVQQMN